MKDPVEIQIMSVLRSSWAQIQHDYTYKKLNADISPAELRTLDAFGRNVILSEQLLNQLSELRHNQQIQEFENIYDLGSFLAKWWNETFNQQIKDLGSLDALLSLLRKLKTTPLSTRGGLLEFLSKHITSTTIESTKDLFPDMELRPAVMIMYHIVREYGYELQPEATHAVRKEKISSLRLQTIMSTVLWLSEFFPPTDWEKPLRLGGPGEKQQVERLLWLATAEPSRLIKNPRDFNQTTGTEDRRAVDELWNVFKGHSSAAVKLALDIADAGILRNIEAEIDQFNRVYMALGRTLKNTLKNELSSC
ncbi:hypothetical protein BJY04DRAFT_196883 [Aspergillus karnatakaensis]|uniref:uncharacterized protein n=1 Tax=Aspergillus karnatakaensis TaxID=1810916 RepID=UPI003CCCD5C8